MSEQESQELAKAVIRSIIKTAMAQAEKEMLYNEHGQRRKHV